MNELTDRFEAERPRLRAVAYRMLGSLSEADDAVQEAWLRLSRSDAEAIDNLGGWLTTVVARVSLNMLRSRAARREQPMDLQLPDPIVDRADGPTPEHEALLADAVGLALFVVLDKLSPAERLAFVLHDMFALPYEEIAPIVDRSPDAARQLASRARRRVQAAPAPDAEVGAQREVIDAFLAAAREGDFEGLVAVLDPDVVIRADRGPVPARVPREIQGAEAVASQALMYARLDLEHKHALVNGAAGVITLRDGEPFAVMSATVRGGKIAEMDFFADPERLSTLDLTILDD
jgi:RNA polymerase sigma-70 factor (ECF subfamily)